jgi:hypothetical protein
MSNGNDLAATEPKARGETWVRRLKLIQPWVPLVVVLCLLLFALAVPSYYWSATLAGIALGTLAAVVAYLWLVDRHHLSDSEQVTALDSQTSESTVSWRRLVWASSIIAAIGTTVLVLVQRETFGFAGALPAAPSTRPSVSLFVPAFAILSVCCAVLTWRLPGRQKVLPATGMAVSFLLSDRGLQLCGGRPLPVGMSMGV